MVYRQTQAAGWTVYMVGQGCTTFVELRAKFSISCWLVGRIGGVRIYQQVTAAVGDLIDRLMYSYKFRSCCKLHQRTTMWRTLVSSKNYQTFSVVEIVKLTIHKIVDTLLRGHWHDRETLPNVTFLSCQCLVIYFIAHCHHALPSEVFIGKRSKWPNNEMWNFKTSSSKLLMLLHQPLTRNSVYCSVFSQITGGALA